ncbi:MAG: DUF992 domain-containing protein [Pseudomonadota bacterium]
MRKHELGVWAGAALAAAMAVSLPGASALAAGGVEAGVLTCKGVPGSGVSCLVFSSRDMDCTYKSVHGEERYRATAGIGLGADLGFKREEWVAFSVIGGTSDVAPEAHSLAGTYLGARASASWGVGAGAAVLAGGGGKSVSLQPLALEANTGVGAMGGLAYLTLEPAPN